MIYFDNAATTKPSPKAVAAFLEAVECYGNPSSLHTLGIQAERVIDEAKKLILPHFPEKGELYFTSGATESNNLAIFGAHKAYRRRGDKIVTTTIEHPSVSRTIEQLSQQENLEVARISPREDYEQEIIDAVDERTVLVSVMAVNNETGFVIDTEKVYNEIKQRYPKCVVHVDGVQGFLKRKLYGDYISISAHKLHGIKGVGGLFVKKGVRLLPIVFGGEQQGGMRSGTQMVELAAAFGAAVDDYHYDYEHYLNLEKQLLQLLSQINGVHINSENNLPNIVNFSVEGVRSEVVLHFLAEQEIYVSSGSACARGKTSSVLGAFGLDRKLADSAIRVSFCKDNTIDEVGQFVVTLENVLKRLRRNYSKLT